MTEATPTYLIHQDDDNPSTLILFAPGVQEEVVKFSTPRYGLWDEDEGCHVEFDSDDEVLYNKVEELREEADDEDGDRFWVNDAFGMDMAPDWFEGFDGKYVHFNAWRGSMTVTYGDEWERYTGGWLTGHPDTATAYKMTASDLYQKLIDGDVEAPFQVIWFFGVTSNVFSMSSDILVPKDRVDDFKTWLDELDGFTSNEMERAFG